MNKTQAKRIAQSGITCGQIKSMLIAAYDAGAADNSRSQVNEGLTKAAAYNIFWSAYRDDPDDKVIYKLGDCLGAMNALREFGEFGEWEIETPKKRSEPPPPYHETAQSPYSNDVPF